MTRCVVFRNSMGEGAMVLPEGREMELAAGLCGAVEPFLLAETEWRVGQAAEARLATWPREDES